MIDKFSLRFGWWLAVLSPVDRIVGLVRCRPNRKNILVVRLDAIGDFILWLDAARALRRMFPRGEYRITLLGNHAWTTLARGLDDFDDVWPVNVERFVLHPVYRLRLMAALRRAGFGTVIHPTYSRELFCGDSVVRNCGAPERIGSSGDLVRTNTLLKRISDAWYTSLLPADPHPLPEIERNAEFMRGLGDGTFTARPPALLIPSQTTVVAPDSDYYVLCPGARQAYRQWPVERFSEIAARIHHKTGWLGVVCGGQADVSLARKAIEGAGVPLENWTGLTSLAQLALLIKNARLVVTNETAAVHMAAGVGARAVCVLGGGQFGRFLPYMVSDQTRPSLPISVFSTMECFGCNWRCIYDIAPGHPKPCVTNVSVDAVWHSVLLVLNESVSDDQGASSRAARGM